jgi:hypothetical protein
LRAEIDDVRWTAPPSHASSTAAAAEPAPPSRWNPASPSFSAADASHTLPGNLHTVFRRKYTPEFSIAASIAASATETALSTVPSRASSLAALAASVAASAADAAADHSSSTDAASSFASSRAAAVAAVVATAAQFPPTPSRRSADF